MPIFCVKSVKIYTGQKNLHKYVRGVRDKYQVCPFPLPMPLWDNSWATFETILATTLTYFWDNFFTTSGQPWDKFEIISRQLADNYETTLGPHGNYLKTIGRAYLCPVSRIWPIFLYHHHHHSPPTSSSSSSPSKREWRAGEGGLGGCINSFWHLSALVSTIQVNSSSRKYSSKYKFEHQV